MTDQRIRDVQFGEIGTQIQVLRSRSWNRLRFEKEYSRQRGTTANSYLIQANQSALIDPPGESFTEIFLQELSQHLYLQKLNYIILGHVNSNRCFTLRSLIALAPQSIIVCTRAAELILRGAIGNCELNIRVVRGEETIDLGEGHQLQFIPIPTPRWPDAMATYDPVNRILFTDKLFGVHVCDQPILDENWRVLDDDRRFYFDCLHAAQTKQVEAAITKLADFSTKIYAPSHGPMVRYSLSRLNYDYRTWCQEQKNQEVRFALLYASAYGNTTKMAHAIAQGITESGVQVESINCEFADSTDITETIERCDGFIIGSPTLAGHAPVQIQTALGLVLSSAVKSKLGGVFGSYGWSGEAIDLIEGRLQDAGYRLGFSTLRIKFTPTPLVLEQCREAGVEFAQSLRKAKKSQAPRQTLTEVQSDRTEQAVGRIIGSLCVVTAKRGDEASALLTSWVSQATFNPPGITIAISHERAINAFLEEGDPLVLNVLAEGRDVRRHFTKPITPGEGLWSGVSTQTALNGCPILDQVLSYMECTVHSRMQCGDHWLIYAIVNHGKVLDAKEMTAVHHRTSAVPY